MRIIARQSAYIRNSNVNDSSCFADDVVRDDERPVHLGAFLSNSEPSARPRLPASISFSLLCDFTFHLGPMPPI